MSIVISENEMGLLKRAISSVKFIKYLNNFRCSCFSIHGFLNLGWNRFGGGCVTCL